MVTIDDAMEMKMEFAEEGTSPLLIPVCIINPDLDLVSFIRVIQPASNNRLDHHLGLHGTTGLFLQQLGPHHHALIHLNLGSGQDHLPSRLTFWAHALHLINKPIFFCPSHLPHMHLLIFLTPYTLCLFHLRHINGIWIPGQLMPCNLSS